MLPASHIVLRQIHLREAQFFSFVDALLDPAHPSDFPGQADFTDKTLGRGSLTIPITGGDADGYCQVDGRLIQLHATCRFEVGILVLQQQARPLFQHGHDQRNPVVVQSACSPAGIPEDCRRNQTLDFGQNRTRALE